MNLWSQKFTITYYQCLQFVIIVHSSSLLHSKLGHVSWHYWFQVDNFKPSLIKILVPYRLPMGCSSAIGAATIAYFKELSFMTGDIRLSYVTRLQSQVLQWKDGIVVYQVYISFIQHKNMTPMYLVINSSLVRPKLVLSKLSNIVHIGCILFQCFYVKWMRNIHLR
jgi:hypothetical protein